MIDRIYFRAAIHAPGQGLVGWASWATKGACVRSERAGQHPHWESAKDSAEAYLNAMGDAAEGWEYVLERVTTDVERFEA